MDVNQKLDVLFGPNKIKKNRIQCTCFWRRVETVRGMWISADFHFRVFRLLLKLISKIEIGKRGDTIVSVRVRKCYFYTSF